MFGKLKAYAAAVAMAALTQTAIRSGHIAGAAGLSGGHRGVARGKTGGARAKRAKVKRRNVVRNRRAHR
jgi:hypothetical protein